MSEATAPPAARSRTAARIARCGAAIAVAAGVAALGGWRLDLGVLKGLLPGFAPMPPDSALCFIALGSALALSIARLRAVRILGAGIASVVLAAALVSGTETLLGVDAGGARLLAALVQSPSLGELPRMSPESAFSFLLLGGSLLALRAPLAQMLASIPLSLAAIALVGFLYGAPPIGSRAGASMSLFSSLAFLAAACGALFRKPETGSRPH